MLSPSDWQRHLCFLKIYRDIEKLCLSADLSRQSKLPEQSRQPILIFASSTKNYNIARHLEK
jgi:hypothetical protein